MVVPRRSALSRLALNLDFTWTNLRPRLNDGTIQALVIALSVIVSHSFPLFSPALSPLISINP